MGSTKKTLPAKKAARGKRTFSAGEATWDAGINAGPLGDPEEGSVGASPFLQPTMTPGVFVNRAGVLVNIKGVALAMTDVLAQDREQVSTLADGAASPARLLKSIAMNPAMPVATRVDAAKAAAPYFDRKMPQAIDGGLNPDGTVVPLLDPSRMQALSTQELKDLKALLAKLDAKME